MTPNNSSYYQMQRELIQIKQGAGISKKLTYTPNPLHLLRPYASSSPASAEGECPAVSLSYSHTYHEMLFLCLWNQSEILRKHPEGQPFSTEETSEIYENFHAFKSHPYAPIYEGVFAITDDVSYAMAVCWQRFMKALPDNTLEQLNLERFHQALNKQISAYTPARPQDALLISKDVTQDDLVCYLESRFKETLDIPKLNRDKFTDRQLILFMTLRVTLLTATLGFVVGGGVLLCSLPLSGMLVPAACAIYVLSCVALIFLTQLAFEETHVALKIPGYVIEEKKRQYHELSKAAMHEFPDYTPKTTDELMDEVPQLEESALNSVARCIL